MFNCGHVVFHRSYAAAGGRNKPLLEVVFGLDGQMMDHHLLVMLHCLVRFLSWLFLYTRYMR